MSSGSRESAEKASIWRLLNPDEDMPRRTIRAAEYIAVRHSLPPSALTRVILNINVCIDRQLDIEKERISKRQRRYNACFEHNKRAFLENQAKKTSLWKSRDELKMNGMNLPTLTRESERLPGMQVVYTNPRYLGDVDSEADVAGVGTDVTLMPYERLRRARTEILRHKHDFYTSKLPTVTIVNEKELRRFKTFCAGEFIRDSLADSRFRILDGSLEKNENCSPTSFVQWLAKRFPDGSSKDNTDYQYKYQHKRRTGVIFPSLVNNTQKPTAHDQRQRLASGPRRKRTNRKSAARGTEGIRHVMGGAEPTTDSGRQYNSPSHKHRFEVKSDVVRS